MEKNTYHLKLNFSQVPISMVLLLHLMADKYQAKGVKFIYASQFWNAKTFEIVPNTIAEKVHKHLLFPSQDIGFSLFSFF